MTATQSPQEELDAVQSALDELHDFFTRNGLDEPEEGHPLRQKWLDRSTEFVRLYSRKQTMTNELETQ